MKMRKLPLWQVILPMLLLMVVACSHPSEERSYGRWDEDQSAGLDEREYKTAWDESGYFSRWDANSNGFLDESEWHSARNHLMEQDTPGSANSIVFEEWDTDDDNKLSEEEFRRGVFQYHDRDQDRFISEEEYNEWKWQAPEE